MTAVAAPVGVAAPAAARRVRAAPAPRRWRVENTFLFLTAFILYMVVADYLVIHLHYTNADAFSRVGNATYVLLSRDPHLGAIGFVWPPLPGFLDIPIIALQHWFPFLVTRAFAGSVQAGLFGAGSVVMINIGLRRAGILLPFRWLVLVAWIANPMVALYSAQGMSEAPFIFFVIASALSFMRWTETRRARELVTLGVLVGLGTLVRVEFIPMAAVYGLGVGFVAARRKMTWRELETTVLLYALPAGFVLFLWIGSMWVIEHDPLYFLRSNYSGQSAATNAFGAGAILDYHSWQSVATYIGGQYLALFPAVVVLGGAVALRVLVARDRRPAMVILALAIPVPLVDMYLLHQGSLALVLRYQTYVIPYTMVLALFLAKELKRLSPRAVSLSAILFAVLIGVSNLASFDLMSNPARAPEEAVAIKAAEQNVTAGNIDPQFDPYDAAGAVSAAVNAADKDRGLIAVDTFRGSSLYLTAPDRSIFVVTSDRNFEAVVNQPTVYHIEYFLVPEPVGESSLDHINQLYPTLWSNGDNFATLVADIGSANRWRLYRIDGATGHG